MKIITYPTYDFPAATDFAGKTAVVIDVLRATSTICSVLNMNCAAVLPVCEREDAEETAKTLDREYVFAGERDGVKIAGFQFGNSPLEFSGIEGKYVILCTTNGTQAIIKAKLSALMLMGCLNNAKAVAKRAAAEGLDIILLSSGTRGVLSTDDITAAGAIARHILDICPDCETDALTETALWLYRGHREKLKELITHSRPYRTLMALDAMRDIDHCLKEDILNNVPVYSDGAIRNIV